MICALFLALGAGCVATGRAKVHSEKAPAEKEKELRDFYARVNREFAEVTFEIDDKRYSRLEAHYTLGLAGSKSTDEALRGEPEFVLQATFSKYRIADYGWEYVGAIRSEPLRFSLSDLKELTPYEGSGFGICFTHPVSTFELNRTDFKLVTRDSAVLTLWMPGLSAEVQAKLKSLQAFLNDGIQEHRRLTGRANSGRSGRGADVRLLVSNVNQPNGAGFVVPGVDLLPPTRAAMASDSLFRFILAQDVESAAILILS